MSLPVAPLALSDEDRAELGRLAAVGDRRAWRSGRGSCWRARSLGRAATPGWPLSWGFPLRRCGSGARGSPRSGTAGLADGARPGRPKAGLVLTDAEREQLTRWARRAKTSQALALRAKIVLACADGRDEQGRRRRAAGRRAHGGPVARPVHPQAPGRAGRRAAARPAAVDPAGQGRGGRHRHPGGDCPGTPRTGRGPRWPGAAACRSPRSGGSGASSTSSRTSSTGSS